MKTPANPLEKEIEKKVCDYARSKGFLHYKFNSPAHRSVPDRLLIDPTGLPFFIEFKRLGEVPTAAQAAEIKRIQNKGTCVLVIDNVQSGKAAIDAFLSPVHGQQKALVKSVAEKVQAITPVGIAAPDYKSLLD